MEHDPPVEYCSKGILGLKYWDLTEEETANGLNVRLVTLLESEDENRLTGMDKIGSAERATRGTEDIF